MFANDCKFVMHQHPPGPAEVTSGGPLNLTTLQLFFDDLLNKHLHKLCHHK